MCAISHSAWAAAWLQPDGCACAVQWGKSGCPEMTPPAWAVSHRAGYGHAHSQMAGRTEGAPTAGLLRESSAPYSMRPRKRPAVGAHAATSSAPEQLRPSHVAGTRLCATSTIAWILQMLGWTPKQRVTGLTILTSARTVGGAAQGGKQGGCLAPYTCTSPREGRNRRPQGDVHVFGANHRSCRPVWANQQGSWAACRAACS